MCKLEKNNKKKATVVQASCQMMSTVSTVFVNLSLLVKMFKFCSDVLISEVLVG